MMAISRQAYFPSLVMTVALIVGCAPAAYTQGITVYEFCYPDDIIVGVNATSYPFVIHSPNYGNGNYPNNVNCSLTIASDQDPVMLLYYFSHFDVEYEEHCDYDSLTVNGVKYCGSNVAARMVQNFLPEWSVSTLRFETDYSVIRPGFEIFVTPYVARN